MIPDKERAAAEARALQMALVLAARIDWKIGRGPLQSTSFAQLLYIEKPQLLLVPTTSGLPYSMRQVDPVVRDTRSDALIVSRPDSDTPVFAFAAWARRATSWTHPLCLWIGESNETWLVPVDGIGDGLGFRLVNALHHAATQPWKTEVERQVGHHRALAWMAKAGPQHQPRC